MLASSGEARAMLVERLLAAVAVRAEIAQRLESPALDRLLRSIVEATVELFEAEAASIALVDSDGKLRFHVAAGPRGTGVVGMTVEPGEGIAGYVQQTGQPIALSDVASDARFQRDAAAQTGYIPRSLLAVPLQLGDDVTGVLEVLDKRGSAGFNLADLARAGVFARQAAVALDVAGAEGSIARLISEAIARVADATDEPHGATDRAIETLVSGAVRDMTQGDGGFWVFVDRVAALRASDPSRLELIADMLEVAIAHLPGGSRAQEPGAGGSWRDRIDPGQLDG